MSEWAAKRFWKTVEISENDQGFGITLDGRSVKTPLKTALTVPSKSLAERVAREWEAVEEKIDPREMPFTRSVNAALDKVSTQHSEVANLIADYADSDLLCYRADTPAELVQRQDDAWEPLLDWIKSKHGVEFTVNTGIMHRAQPAKTVAYLRDWTHSLNNFQLTGFHDLVSLSGSFILGMSAAERAFEPAKIWAFSRVDENWQSEQWGNDGEADSVAALKQRSFLHACEFFQLIEQ